MPVSDSRHDGFHFTQDVRREFAALALLYFALSKPALLPEVRAVGEREEKQPGRRNQQHDRRKDTDKHQRRGREEKRQRRGNRGQRRYLPAALQSQLESTGLDEKREGDGIARRLRRPSDDAAGRQRGRSDNIRSGREARGRREQRAQTRRALSSWRGGAGAKTSAPNRRAKYNS